MTHEPCPCDKTPARPRPWQRALLALALAIAALLTPRGLAEETPAAPAAKAAPGPLCFTAESDGATVALQAVGEAPKVALEISTDGETWQEWKEPRTAKLAHKGDRVYVRAVSANGAFSEGIDIYHHFVITGKAAASGSVMSLLDRDDKRRSLKDLDCAFAHLFDECKGLTAAPELPATTIESFCYEGMFYGCTGLATAPALPATTLSLGCYEGMFNGCTGLKAAPALPATILDEQCYQGMFAGCAGLTAAPELPATIMVKNCYRDMFADCKALTVAPQLPATELSRLCYQRMFAGCTRLTAAPKIPANATGMKESGHETMLGGGMALPKGAKAETIAPKDLKKAKKK